MPVYIDGSETITVNDGILSPNFGRKNAIINGNFDIWQRGTSQTSSGYGSDDRWRNGNVGSTKTNSQQSFTAGQTDVPNEPKFYCRTVVSSVSGTGNFVNKAQRIEGVRTYSGQTVTLSFWAKADAAKNIAVSFAQSFGTGGSPSSTVTGIGAVKAALTTSWQKITLSVDIPSISGKTIGTDGNDFLSLRIWFDAGSNIDSQTDSLGQQSGTFDIAQVQLEKGSVATDFEQRPIGEELALCQRYYWRGAFNGGGLGYKYGTTGNTNMEAGQTSFPVEMRTVPTKSIVVTPSYVNCSFDNLISNKNSLMERVIVSATGIYRAFNGVYEADAEL